MTLLVVAADTDGTARRFADFANSSGVATVLTAGFGRVGVTVRATRNRACTARITFDGVDVRGVLTRGIGEWGQESDPERAFISSEKYAAYWSVLALWPGPVVNRPSPDGFFPRLDPLELVRVGAVAAPRTVILNDGTAPGNDVYRLPGWTRVDVDLPRSRFDVVQVCDSDSTRVHRVLVAADAAFEVGGSERRLEPDVADLVAPVLAWLRHNDIGFADFTIEHDGGIPRLLDVSCFPSHHLFPHIEEQVYAALLNRLIQ
jgi:hypothetical protein